MAALPLHRLLGTLVADLIRGESEAAQASADFLRGIGFIGGRGADDWGRIRFIRFAFSAQGPDGQTVERVLRVPLLTLLPIPLQQVQQAEYEFFLRVDDVVDRTKREEAHILGDVAPYALDQAATAKMPRIRVKLSMKQSDIPAGLASSLRRIVETSGEPPR